ncbi:MAG: hypothetical protein ACLQU3_10120 [Limisphaerales bacterium]|jgi:hypothetical protein
MGLLNFFAKPAPELVRLPSGSFTVDLQGSVLMGTLPSSFPAGLVKDIAQQVRATFGEAAKAQLPLAEIIINYPSLKICARELRGGAIVFLSPKAPSSPASQS